LFRRQTPEVGSAETGTYALHTLAENETIARLATGVERFELPDEHNPFALLKQVVQDDSATKSEKRGVTAKLAEMFQNRRQFPRAAEYFRELAAEPGPKNQHYRDQLKQLTGNWGRFEPVMSQPAGQGATVDFRFRNGQRVELTAHRIKVPELLEAVKAYLKANPRKLAWNEVLLENLGYRLVTSGQKKYLGQEVARWSLNLEPLADHFDLVVFEFGQLVAVAIHEKLPCRLGCDGANLLRVGHVALRRLRRSGINHADADDGPHGDRNDQDGESGDGADHFTYRHSERESRHMLF
jgi:hypothetical protein